MSDERSQTLSEVSPTLLRWRVHPLARKPIVSAAVILLLIATAVLIVVATGSPAFATLGTVLFFVSLGRFWFPTTYTLTEAGLEIRTLAQTVSKPWSGYRSYWPDKNGVLLSPFARQSRLENFRGQYVMFEQNRDAVMTIIQNRIDAVVAAELADAQTPPES